MWWVIFWKLDAGVGGCNQRRREWLACPPLPSRAPRFAQLMYSTRVVRGKHSSELAPPPPERGELGISQSGPPTRHGSELLPLGNSVSGGGEPIR